MRSNFGIEGALRLILRKDDDYEHPATCKIKLFKENVYNKYTNAKYIFIDDDRKVLEFYGEFGLTLKAPELWEFIDVLTNFYDTQSILSKEKYYRGLVDKIKEIK